MTPPGSFTVSRPAKGRPSTEQGAALRDKFLARVGSLAPFQQLFDHLPGISFFVKNAKSQLISASRHKRRRLDVANEGELAGTTDYDYFPPHIADSFVRDDQQVMRTGRPLLHHVEVWINEQRMLDWFVTNKFPLRDRSGKIIGVIGTVQSYEGKRDTHLPFSEIGAAVDYIRGNLQEKISVEQLAKLCAMSPRQLHRKFRLAFGIGVQEFLARTRIQAASEALARTKRPIADIALDLGFCDQSALTHQFRQRTGSTPRQFRQRYYEPLLQTSAGDSPNQSAIG